MNDTCITQKPKAERPVGEKWFIRMFKPTFHGMVERGEKCQTVRPVPKDMPVAGDMISLRGWTDKPYRSKQKVLRVARLVRVVRCEISAAGVKVGAFDVNPGAFAVADGFSCWEEMKQWFEAEHGLPFVGVLLKWEGVPGAAGAAGSVPARVDDEDDAV